MDLASQFANNEFPVTKPSIVVRNETHLQSASQNRSVVSFRRLKRGFDVVFSLAALLIGFIPGVFLALVVAFECKANPFYVQQRVGKSGKPFYIVKFRSMVVDADNVEKYCSPQQLEQWRVERKIHNDPRITRTGKLLRKTSLDELPQLINVLKGDLSIIGPRPITFDELGHFGNDAAELLTVRPGISGLWQTTDRNKATFESGARQKIELEYVRNESFKLDVFCFLKTFDAVLKLSGK